MTQLSRLMRFALIAICATLGVSAWAHASGSSKYQPTETSLDSHPVPAWYRDAKLGIFVHWGLYSVPGWAPVQGPGNGDFENSQWFKLNPYSEWYYNTVRIEGSPTQKYHREHYGSNFDYYQFADTFNVETKKWKPEKWAGIFRDAGARYVVLTTKHHDGFTLWPSMVKNPHLPPNRQHSERDIVADFMHAVRQDGMHAGLYYSGGFDWTFVPGPFHNQDEAGAGTPQSEEYASYADAQYRELISRYKPDLLWNDIRYPKGGKALRIFAEYYNAVPAGVINDRWSPFLHSDFTTPEYKNLSTINPKQWEECRGLGQSFGYNRAEGSVETIAADQLVRLLVDIVSKNGNLLLDVGPEADGTIPEIQMDRLRALGDWLKQNGEAIYGTSPWKRAEGKTADGIDIRFTRKGDALYAVLLSRPSSTSITLTDVQLPKHAVVTMLGWKTPLQWSQQGNDLEVQLPASIPGQYAWTLKSQ